MDVWFFLPLLTMVTLLAVVVFALVSKARTEALMRDPNAPKSTLASDGPGPNTPTPATAEHHPRPEALHPAGQDTRG
jgi:hypothetical protein